MSSPKPIGSSEPAERPARLSFELPFVGREKEMARLRVLHAERKHVLVLGPSGVGKSALVRHMRGGLSLLVSAVSGHFGAICGSLEPEVGLEGAGLRLLERKRRLRAALGGCGRTVVFDGVGWTGPKVSSFIESVAERTSVWVCARSEHPWDIGHIWPLLARFARVEVRAFHLSETRALVEAAVRAWGVPGGALDAVERLHRLAGGVPHVLCDLLERLGTGLYDPHRLFDLKLLDLDRRIEHVAAGRDPEEL